MTQAFRVLWFEDQLEGIANQRAELVEQAREEHGIELTFEDRPVVHDDILEELKHRQRLYHDFDFVVLDYDLGGATTGDIVASRLRKDFGFVPMVFYSGNFGGVSSLREQLVAADVDGVHCVTRRELVEFLTDQLHEMLHPLSRIETIRGSAVGAVADCDGQLRKWFSERHNKLGEDNRKKIESKLDDNISESNAGRDKQWQGKSGDLPWKIERADSYQFMRIARTLADMHNETGLPSLEEFSKDLLGPRNILGHVVAERTSEGIVLRSSHGGELSSDELAELRRRMAHMRDVILKFAATDEAK